MMTIQNCARAMLALLFVTASARRSQNVLAVPAQFSSIQAAINAAIPGDTVLVAPGTYFERIDFIGKAITVQGAGAGVSLIDAGQLGSGVTFQSFEGPGSVLDGFTVTNGTGTLLTPGIGITPELRGGGILIAGASIAAWPAIQPSIRNCEISGNTAKYGAGVFAWNRALLTMANCVVSNNQAVYATGTPISTGGGVQTYLQSGIFLDGCLISGNSAANCGGILAQGSGLLAWQDVIRNTTISQNSAFLASTGGAFIGVGGSTAPFLVQNCLFEGNSATTRAGGVTCTAFQRFENCIFVGNSAAIQGGAAYSDTSPIGVDFVNCTFFGNTAPNGSVMTAYSLSPNTIRNSLLWGNSPNPIQAGPAIALTVTNSNCQPGVTGATNISIDPLFIDAANGDFRLSLGSPSINAANGALTNLPATEYFGNPRSLFGAPDHGAIEQTDIALDPSMAGNAGAPLLTLNGSSGGASRRVAVGLTQTMTVGVGQPATSALPARFIVFGALGVPSYADPVALPFGIGTMSFTPCVLAPAFAPLLFVLTNNFGPDPCGEYLPSTLTPWNSPLLGPIPFPLDVTLQAVIEAQPGVLAVTNGVIAEIR